MSVGGVVKRGTDVVIASVLLVLLAPLLALIALCVLVESPGPVFYRARRVGRDGRPLDVLKFRKMSEGAAGLALTLYDDERFTRIGRWLARTKLDELPQIFTVFCGGMSLIGPRPEDPRFVERHREAFEPILQVRPGITGLSQLAFVAESAILDLDHPVEHYEQSILPQKLQLDTLYVSRWRLRLDVQILYWTAAATLLRIPVSVNQSTGRITLGRGSGGRRQRLQTYSTANPASDVTGLPQAVSEAPVTFELAERAAHGTAAGLRITRSA